MPETTKMKMLRRQTSATFAGHDQSPSAKIGCLYPLEAAVGYSDALASPHRYVVFNSGDSPATEEEEEEEEGEEEFPMDLYAGNEFRMYEFKVRRCGRARSHDWTDCPFAHPGEKARRRDPRAVQYSGAACPDFRKGQCKRGDGCEYAHGVFECWLHPARYRTQPCKDGTACRRRVCFFAHTPEQLRVVSPRSPPDSCFPKFAPSPASPPESGPVLSSLRRLQLSSPPAARRGAWFDGEGVGEVEAMVRVESGRGLRAKIFEKLAKENLVETAVALPDIGWVSELVM